ncbi:MAG: hypothetical protein RBR28_04785 [Lentimicrobium sp.]|jgi:hypothetical protein|nr:hypothetical protein [Lentimicrobium sp.]
MKKQIYFYLFLVAGTVYPQFADAQFVLSGEFRPRMEYHHGYKQPANDDMDAALFVSQRSRIETQKKEGRGDESRGDFEMGGLGDGRTSTGRDGTKTQIEHSEIPRAPRTQNPEPRTKNQEPRTKNSKTKLSIAKSRKRIDSGDQRLKTKKNQNK